MESFYVILRYLNFCVCFSAVSYSENLNICSITQWKQRFADEVIVNDWLEPCESWKSSKSPRSLTEKVTPHNLSCSLQWIVNCCQLATDIVVLLMYSFSQIIIFVYFIVLLSTHTCSSVGAVDLVSFQCASVWAFLFLILIRNVPKTIHFICIVYVIAIFITFSLVLILVNLCVFNSWLWSIVPFAPLEEVMSTIETLATVKKYNSFFYYWIVGSLESFIHPNDIKIPNKYWFNMRLRDAMVTVILWIYFELLFFIIAFFFCNSVRVSVNFLWN